MVVANRETVEETLAKKRLKLDADEQQLVASVERDEWKSIDGGKRGRARYARYAGTTLHKGERKNTPLPSNNAETEGELIAPRLLNMRQAAAYLGCSFWTARDYVLQGLIRVVDAASEKKVSCRRRARIQRCATCTATSTFALSRGLAGLAGRITVP